MPTLHLRIAAPIIGATLVLLQPGLTAAQADEERWYQVELLIFSNEGAAGAEQWPAIPTLAYPNASRFLVNPQRVEANAASHEGSSELDAYGRQFLKLPEEDLALDDAATDIPEPATEWRTELEANPGLSTGTAQDPNTVTAALSTSRAGAADNEISAEPPAPLTPTPFITLPTSSREFYGKAAYMQRSGYYTTLFHESWVQPVRAEGDALPIIIDQSGDTRQWPQLQGSIKLHISRYLHVETNLWLNTAGDYLPGEWRMPAPPLGPVSLIIEVPEPDSLAELDGADAGTDFNFDPLPTETELALADAQPVVEPVYSWRHAVLLHQKRRMRSGEVHYIDHPLLGVVIKLTPLDSDQLLEMADAQALATKQANKQAKQDQ